MKTRELEMYISKCNDYKKDCWSFRLEPFEGAIKAKLIIPVEPEIVEHEWDFNGVLKLPMAVLDKLQGRRWKCRFEEIVE